MAFNWLSKADAGANTNGAFNGQTIRYNNSGTTTVSAGRLAVANSLPNSNVTVNGGELGGVRERTEYMASIAAESLAPIEVEDSEAFSGAGLYDSFSGCAEDDTDADNAGPSRCDTS